MFEINDNKDCVVKVSSVCTIFCVASIMVLAVSDNNLAIELSLDYFTHW